MHWPNGKLQSNHLFSLHLKVIQSVHIFFYSALDLTNRTTDRSTSVKYFVRSFRRNILFTYKFFPWCFSYFSFLPLSLFLLELCVLAHRTVRFGNKHTRLRALGSQSKSEHNIKEQYFSLLLSSSLLLLCWIICVARHMKCIEIYAEKYKSVNANRCFFRCVYFFILVCRRVLSSNSPISWWNYFIIFVAPKWLKFPDMNIKKREPGEHKTVSLWERWSFLIRLGQEK